MKVDKLLVRDKNNNFVKQICLQRIISNATNSKNEFWKMLHGKIRNDDF